MDDLCFRRTYWQYRRNSGDINDDSLINILDVIQTVNIILGTNANPTDYELWAADMNQDGNIDILDIVLIVNTILG